MLHKVLMSARMLSPTASSIACVFAPPSSSAYGESPGFVAGLTQKVYEGLGQSCIRHKQQQLLQHSPAVARKCGQTDRGPSMVSGNPHTSVPTLASVASATSSSGFALHVASALHFTTSCCRINSRSASSLPLRSISHRIEGTKRVGSSSFGRGGYT